MKYLKIPVVAAELAVSADVNTAGVIFKAILRKLKGQDAQEMPDGVKPLWKLVDAALENDVERQKQISEARKKAGASGGKKSKRYSKADKTKSDKPPVKTNDQTDQEIDATINYLNQKTNSDFKTTTASHRSFIRARLNDGHAFEDLCAVINLKTKDWMGTEQEKYLRPQTLFNASKFEGYLAEEKRQAKTKQQHQARQGSVSESYSQFR